VIKAVQIVSCYTNKSHGKKSENIDNEHLIVNSCSVSVQHGPKRNLLILSK